MLPFAFEVNNFFPFRETFCFTVEPVVFFNREERLCSPSLQESTVFFVSAKLLRLRFRKPFSLVAKGEFALNKPRCQATKTK